ncbi:RrF2 family transcriptional regulator [Lactiplantibacillus modestisalitolerans]
MNNMQLAKSFERSACILVLLATQEPAVPITAAVIHQRIGGSASYLRKIIRKLAVAGLVTSTSGNNGGVHLARAPETISITDLVAALEGTLHTFPNTGDFDRVFQDIEPVANAGTKIVSDLFAQADQRWLDFLAQQTLASLIKQLLMVETIPVLDWTDQSSDKMAQLNALLARMRRAK